MALSVKHQFQTGKGDGPDTTRVKPSNWNAEHVLITDTPGIVLGRGVAAGPGPIQELPLSSLFPSGIILPYGGATAPDANWLMCYGQLLSRTVEASLFAAIGTAYGGGDGVNTFAAPDGRGAVLAGKSNMGGADKGNLAGANVLGALLGGQYNATGTFNMGGTINVNFGNAGFVQTFGATVDTGNTIGNGTGQTVPITPPNAPVQVQGYTPLNGNFGVGVSGGSNLFSIVQPTLITNFIIKR
jgi:microcystin-dependent protein